MSKHLLYCKDLLNRILTRSLLFVLALLIVLTQVFSPAEAAGPLSVKPTNPRYFFDSKGNPVYLTGSYLNEYNMLNGSWDFASYLDFLRQQKQNFTRVWGWEQSPWLYDQTGQISFSAQPYERTGPGLALDGALKFDLTRFNQTYFDQLRSRAVQAAQQGIYISVMLFEGFSTQKQVGQVNPWLGDPFVQANNINGINGDPNQNGGGEEFFSLTFPPLVSLQEAFARKVVDTLNDLDNVLYEVSGDGLAGSLLWQYHMIDYIKTYQATKPNQHPVGISQFAVEKTGEVIKSSADWIVLQATNLNPPPATDKKIFIVEGSPASTGKQVLLSSPISLVQLLPAGVVATQTQGILNGLTPLLSSTTSSILNTAASLPKYNQRPVATPTITPDGGIYTGAMPVTLQTSTQGATIYYTTDGQSPTPSSQRYTAPFALSASTLVKAKAFKSDLDPSAEASAWFASSGGGSGPLAYWKFDETSGTSAADSSGNGNTGTLMNGPLWTAGRVGNALFFDGINDNVTIADSNSLDLSSSFTLSAWVNPASTFTDFRSILVKNYSYYLYASVAGYCGDGNPLVGFSAATAQTVCQPSPLPINTWTHLVVTYNGSTLTLYQNGVAVATSNVSGTLSPTTGTLQIGGSQYGEYFKGLIDEVRIYNRALSASEIQTLYQQDSPLLAAASQTLAPPVISPNGGNYSGSVPVTMQTATSNASIYYTTDGSSPTQSSTLYTGNMTLTSSATVKAKAFKSGANASAEASASFTVTQPFSFSVSNSGDKSVIAGSSVTNSISTTLVSGSPQSVALSASGLPTGATASFSSTSCSPGCSSTFTVNTSSSTAAGSSNVTVTASGGGVTKTTTFSLTVSLPTIATVATPTITPNGGSFTSSVSVTMQTATSGASIYYTTNGSSPTQSSTLYTGAMALTTNSTVKAQAFKSGYNASTQTSASFTVAQAFNFSLSNSGGQSVVAGSSVNNSISATLASGSAQAVTFSASGLPTGATASFSSTSCSPACSSTLTINTGSSTPAGSSNITVSATGGGVTKTTTFSLAVTLPTVAAPAISPNGGSFTNSVSVTMQTATSGATIYYTTDGSSPTQSSILYTGAMTLTSSATVEAKAFKNGYNSSAEASASFTVSSSGLVAYWKFDEGSGTSVSDSSGNGNTGTLVNGPLWTAGRVGNALFFDGINDNVTIADSNSLDLSSSFTLSAWVNPASTFTDFRSILVKNYSYYLYASSTWYCSDGSPLGGFSAATAQTVCQPSPLPINTWTHLAVTYNGSALTLYRDGVAVTTSTVSGTLSPTTGTLQIGGSQYGEYFKGFIDEVRIYNRALSATEIQTIYQQDSGTTVQTVATPVISPNGGNYSGSVPVTMQTATSGASIYYTTDGTSPTQSSTLYTGNMTLTNSATVKAKAFKSGANASAEASASFTLTQPFNFSLANSGDKSVVAGSSVTNSINATLTSGSAQTVTLSASGLPTGATASFSSISCSPTCSSTLTINTNTSMPAGGSTITVTATGGGVTKTTTFNLTVSLPTLPGANTSFIATATCDYYASPTGRGNGLSQSSPFQIADFWSVAAPGTTLCLLDGVYADIRSNIYPPNGMSGTASAPITIAALNDGSVRIDGQNSRIPVLLLGNSYFVIQGINANNSSGSVVGLSSGSNYNIIRKVVAWDARDENDEIFGIHYSNHNLLEDVAGFGVARKIFSFSQNGNDNTCRRCWGRWEGSTNVGPKDTFELVYNNNGNLYENIIGTWDNGSMPSSYVLQNNGALWTGPGAGTYTAGDVDQPYAVIGEGDPAVANAGIKIFGSIAYVKAADKFQAPGVYFLQPGGGGISFNNVVSMLEPGGQTSIPNFLLASNGTETGLSIVATESVGAKADVFQGAWIVSNIENGGSIGQVSSIYDGSKGAGICYRYQNASLTGTPLWPWPMNQRILDATSFAAASDHQHYIYQGTSPTLTLVNDPHAPVDVTATIENMFGPIPAACKSLTN